MPSLTRTKLMRAEARSNAARDRLLHTVDEIKARLHQSALAAAAQDELRATAEALVCKGASAARRRPARVVGAVRSEEHTSESQSLMRKPYAVFSLTKNNLLWN